MAVIICRTSHQSPSINGPFAASGKTKARAWIEDSVLRRYAMRTPDANRSGYILTLTYATDAELDATIYDLLREVDMIADLRHCFTEADVRALEGSDRYW